MPNDLQQARDARAHILREDTRLVGEVKERLGALERRRGEEYEMLVGALERMDGRRKEGWLLRRDGEEG